MLLGKPDGGVSHALFVTALMHLQITAVLFQRLAQPQHIAVTKNRKHPGHKFALDPIDLHVLVVEKFHQSLGHGQSCRTHVCTLEHAQPLHALWLELFGSGHAELGAFGDAVRPALHHAFVTAVKAQALFAVGVVVAKQ